MFAKTYSSVGQAFPPANPVARLRSGSHSSVLLHAIQQGRATPSLPAIAHPIPHGCAYGVHPSRQARNGPITGMAFLKHRRRLNDLRRRKGRTRQRLWYPPPFEQFGPGPRIVDDNRRPVEGSSHDQPTFGFPFHRMGAGEQVYPARMAARRRSKKIRPGIEGAPS
jgi:hypothetical protein